MSNKKSYDAKKISLILFPQELFNKEIVLKEISKKTSILEQEIKDFRIIRQSIDARKSVKYNVEIEYILKEEKFQLLNKDFTFRDVTNSESIIIVGAGPAGYFAAIECLLQGIKPIIFERGKSVDERKFDISKINSNETLNFDSNYVFGEGGAGTYSDGKLFTRSKKRGDNNKILQLLHFFGAEESVLIESHPHIGTDKLHDILQNIRKKIIDCGGEIYFNSKVVDLLINNEQLNGIKLENGEEFQSNFVILATGHSARDVYEFLYRNHVQITNKNFAMGIRVEHPQELIDKIQYKQPHGEFLPPASYNLVKQINGRGVYSFCMCPGGTIVNSSSESNSIVVNGMSNSKRNSPYANSGIVVEIREEDCLGFSENKIFSGSNFQKEFENLAYRNAASNLKAPAQRLTDFVAGKISRSLPECSYTPGLINSPLHFWLPEIIRKHLQLGFLEFNKQMRGFLTNEAVIVGVESRTSSPVKIERDKVSLSTNIKGLYACGEGAGFAGGIVSSAIDAQNVVMKIVVEIR
ncbi:MAG: NAD(P)/FAD-dependent oxidoreductase [Bacteroidales bacterium]|jgi:uncharacterized FAD-dependent dehydrogenase|nr:NAD(P)/FAD-dependent oxidoreductase [Bacteroidales bacterium]